MFSESCISAVHSSSFFLFFFLLLLICLTLLSIGECCSEVLTTRPVLPASVTIILGILCSVVDLVKC